MGLQPIIKDRMDLEINDQLSVTLFPDDEGQPKVDVIKLNFTETSGKKTSLFMTPCEAMEIASVLNTAVQFYLYNQEQYREEILGPRFEMAGAVESEEEKNHADDLGQILTGIDIREIDAPLAIIEDEPGGVIFDDDGETYSMEE